MLGNLKTTDEGRPLHPRSIFICIQRVQLPSRELIDRSLQKREVLGIPAKFCGDWDIIKGIVTQVRIFADGMLVLIDARVGSSLLKNWECAPLWIPHCTSSSAGILATWQTNSQ